MRGGGGGHTPRGSTSYVVGVAVTQQEIKTDNLLMQILCNLESTQ